MKRICCLMCLIWAIIPLMAAVRRETFDLISLLRMRSPLPGWIAAEITYSWALSQLPSRYSRTSPSHRLDPDLITSCLFLQSFKRSTRSLPEMISTHKHIKSQSIQQPTKYHSTELTLQRQPNQWIITPSCSTFPHPFGCSRATQWQCTGRDVSAE